MSSSLFQTQESIFQKQSNGEISFAECWKQQKQLLERCGDILRAQLEEQDSIKQSDEIPKNDKDFILTGSYMNSTIKKEGSPDPEDTQNKTNCLNVKIEEMAIKDEAPVDTIIKNEDAETAEIKYGCKVCNFRSKRCNNLKAHVERTHLRLKFFCKLCDVAFKERGPLKIHIKSKTDENPLKFFVFECGVCLYNGTEEEFITHVEEKHIVVYDVFKQASKNIKDDINQPAEKKNQKWHTKH